MASISCTASASRATHIFSPHCQAYCSRSQTNFRRKLTFTCSTHTLTKKTVQNILIDCSYSSAECQTTKLHTLQWRTWINDDNLADNVRYYCTKLPNKQNACFYRPFQTINAFLTPTEHLTFMNRKEYLIIEWEKWTVIFGQIALFICEFFY